MDDETAHDRLVSRLLSAPKVFPAERAVIAALADRGVIDAPGFAAACVRDGEWAYVQWRGIEQWIPDGHAHGKWVRSQVALALEVQGYDESLPPSDAESLQVALALDDPKGWVVAAWRDIYADRGQSTEVDMCLEHLTDQHLCWDCGDLGVAEHDDLFWCDSCMPKEKSK